VDLPTRPKPGADPPIRPAAGQGFTTVFQPISTADHDSADR